MRLLSLLTILKIIILKIVTQIGQHLVQIRLLLSKTEICFVSFGKYAEHSNMHNTLKSLRLTLLNIEQIQLDKQWNYRNIISPFSRLYLVTAGEAQVLHHDRIFTLKPGHLYLIPSFTYSQYQCNEYMEQYYVHFLEEMDGGLSMYQMNSFHYELPALDLDTMLMKRLLEINPNQQLARNHPKQYDNRASLLSFSQQNTLLPHSSSKLVETNGILLQLLSRFFQETNPKEVDKVQSYQRLTKAIRYINEHLHEPLSVEELSEMSHLHVDYFSRLFKKIMGLRPSEYINNKRIEQAQFMLVSTDITMKEIAERVGISSEAYFSRLFKKITQKTPSQYRKDNWDI